MARSCLVLGVAISAIAALWVIHGSRAADRDIAIRLYDKELPTLIDAAEEQLNKMGAAASETVLFTGTREAALRVQLDSVRNEMAGITLPEVGRALAIASDGMVVGQTVQNDKLFNLRLHLPASVAGERFERLLLRGEQKNRPAIYLRDVGEIHRELQPRERLRINGKPAVEIVVRFNAPEIRTELERWARSGRAPAGITVVTAPVAK